MSTHYSSKRSEQILSSDLSYKSMDFNSNSQIVECLSQNSNIWFSGIIGGEGWMSILNATSLHNAQLEINCDWNWKLSREEMLC